MSLAQRIDQDLKDALRAKDAVTLGAVRMLKAALLEKAKAGAGAVSEADEVAAVQKQAKQRRDAIEQFRAAGRADLAQKEADELAVIERYLPAQLSDEEIEAVVRGLAAGAEGPAAMGKVMGALRGKADGTRVRAVVERVLKG